MDANGTIAASIACSTGPPQALARWTRDADAASSELAGPATGSGAKALAQGQAVLLRWRRRAGRRLRPVAVFVLRAVAAGERALRRAATRGRPHGATHTRCNAHPNALHLRASSPPRPCPGRLPVHRVPRRSRSGSRDTRGCRRRGRPRSTRRRRRRPTPTCWSRWRCSPAACARAAIRRRRPSAAWAASSSASGRSASPSSSSSTCPPASTRAPRPRASPAPPRSSRRLLVELAACGGLILGGLLYYARPCRTRINLSQGPQAP